MAEKETSPAVMFVLIAFVGLLFALAVVPLFANLVPPVVFVVTVYVIVYLAITMLPWIVAHFRRHERRLAILGLSIGVAAFQISMGLNEMLLGGGSLLLFQPSMQLQIMNVALFIAYLGLLGWAAIGRRDAN